MALHKVYTQGANAVTAALIGPICTRHGRQVSEPDAHGVNYDENTLMDWAIAKSGSSIPFQATSAEYSDKWDVKTWNVNRT